MQLPVSKLSRECYKERKAGAGQTLTALGSCWKGPKPLTLVRAIVLGLLLAAGDDPDRDRDIFLEPMLMDEEGRLKRKKRFHGKMVARVMELLPEAFWSRAIELTDRGRAWKGRLDPAVRQDVEIEAFLEMGWRPRCPHLEGRRLGVDAGLAEADDGVRAPGDHPHADRIATSRRVGGIDAEGGDGRVHRAFEHRHQVRLTSSSTRGQVQIGSGFDCTCSITQRANC